MADSLETTGPRSHVELKSKANVLLVDDQPTSLVALRASLGDLGHNLVEASSSDDALRQILEDDFAVVLLDVQLPVRNGFETATLIRERDRNRHTPIIFITGSDCDREMLEMAYSLGAVDFLMKPLIPVILKAKVQHFVELLEERRRVEREADQLRLLIEGTRDYAMCLLDAEGRVASWNPGAERIMQYRADEIVGQLASRFSTQEAIERGQPNRELEIARNEGRFEDEGWRVRKDGTHYWASVIITALHDEHGKLRGYSKITRDLSDRKRSEEHARRLAENELRHSEQRFAGFMQHLPGLAWIKDAEGRYVYANDAAEKAFRTSRSDLYGKTDVEVFPPETAAQFQRNDRQAIQSGTGVQVVESLEHADGEVHHSLVSKFPIVGADGEVSLVGGMAIDITDQRRVEQSLKESEEKLRLLADTIPQLAWMARGDGSIFWFNRRCYEYTGKTLEQLEGWGWRSLLAPDASPEVLQRWSEALESGEPFDMVFPLLGADGQFHPFLTRVNPLKDEQGELLNWFGTNTDISEIKRMEEALRNADRRKDEFLATLAHELRNPLAPIRNALQILKLPDVEASIIQQSREMMERQVEHLVRLVDDLLDVSRVMRGKIELRREPVELDSIIARAVETVLPLIEQQGHRLHVSISAESMWLHADSVRLAQVIGNLLTNAAKYTEPHGQIWLTARREGDSAILQLRDSGIGIAPDMLPHVFELFMQADHSATRSQGGLGIGLTLVKNLVNMHGGTVEVHSAGLGQGSEFAVRLPLLLQEPQSPRDEARGEQPQPPSSPVYRLLVVDDNQDAAVSLSTLLQLQGHRVQVAHNGPTALEIATTFRPDMILLDIGMPGMDGYEVARRMRQQPGLEHVVITALTGWGQQEDRQRTANAGFNHHLVKPLEPEALERVLAGLRRESH